MTTPEPNIDSSKKPPYIVFVDDGPRRIHPDLKEALLILWGVKKKDGS